MSFCLQPLGVSLDISLSSLELAANTVVVVSGAGASDAGSAGKTLTSAESATNRAGLTLEAVEALLTASQDTTLLLEVGHADSGKSRGGVVLSSVVVNLVDGNGGVDDGGLDSLCNRN